VARCRSILAGTPLLNVALDRGSQEPPGGFCPRRWLFSVLILGIVPETRGGRLGGDVRGGRHHALDHRPDGSVRQDVQHVTITLPSLLIVLSLSAGIHIVLRIQSLLADLGERQVAMRRTIREVIPRSSCRISPRPLDSAH